MLHAHTRQRTHRWLSMVLFMSIMTGCSQMDGCEGPVVSYPAEGLKVDRAVQVHLTERGLNTMEGAIVPLLASQIGGTGGGNTLSICLPKTTDSFEICGDLGADPATPSFCADQTLGCQLDLNVEEIQINPIDNGDGTSSALSPDNLEVRVIVGEMDEIIPIKQGIIECDIHAWLEPGQTISFETEVEFNINATSDYTELRLLDTETGVNVDQLNIEADGFCSIGNIPELQDFVKSQLNLVMRPLIVDAAESALCKPCVTSDECPLNAACDAETSICVSTITDQCIARDLGLEGYFELGSLLSAVTPGLEAGLYYSAYAATYADSENTTDRLSLGLQAGFTSDHNDCVNYVEPPSAQAMMRAPELEAINAPNGDPYGVSIGISKRALDHALWALYNSGVLCLEVSSSTIEQISTSALIAFLPSIRKIAGNDPQPAKLKLFPNKPPYVRFGSGEVIDNNGELTLVEPPITIVIEDLDIDLYAFAFGRYVRLFTINTQVEFGIGLVTTANNELQILLGDTSNIFQNIVVTNNELLSDDVSKIETLLPTLVQIALPLLTDSLADPIALPDLLGFKLDIVQTTGIGNNTVLGVFADLEYNPSTTGQLGFSVDTDARLQEVIAPIGDYVQADGTLAPINSRDAVALSPRVLLSVTSQRPAQVEGIPAFSYRVDGGLWSAFSTGDTLDVQSALFMMQGMHKIEVRSQLQGQPDTLDPTPTSLDVLIDWSAPAILSIVEENQIATITAEDAVDSPEQLTFRHRVLPGDWSEWHASPVVDLSDYEGRQVRFEAEARDQSGNLSASHQTMHIQRVAPIESAGTDAPNPAAQSNDTSWACSATTSATSRSLPLAPLGVLLFALLLWTRRRRHNAALIAVAAATVMTAGCDDEASNRDDNDTSGECVAGVDPDCPCSEDAQCGTDQVCRNGACGPVDMCATDSECQEGQSCIDSNGDGALECVFPACGAVEECDASVCMGDNVVKCQEGLCICDLPCKDGCPDGQYCCNQQDSCTNLPNECTDHACEPGFRAAVETAGTPDPSTCMVSDPVCTCEALPPLSAGIYGVHSDLDANETAGIIAHSSYNSTYGDLMLGLSAADGVMTWTYLDGVPADAEVEGQIDGPRRGISDKGADVGNYSSIAVADDGTLHIAYQDVDVEALTYALGVPAGDGSYTWTMHLVDEDGSTGLWTDLSLDPTSGAPVISYVTASVDPGDGALVSQLRLATAGNAAPSAAGDWTLQTLEEASVEGPCGAACAEGSACRIDTMACEALADPETEPCTAPCGVGAECFAGDVCAVTNTKPPAVSEWPYLVAIHVQQTRAPADLNAIVYHDSILGRLMIIREQSAGVYEPAAVLVGDGSSRTGLWPSLAFDDSGNEHLAFVSEQPRFLQYLDVTNAATEIVDDGRRDNDMGNFTGTVPVGADANLWFEGTAAKIAYQNGGDLTISVATREGDNSWTRAEVAGSGRGAEFIGSFGFYIDHIVLAGSDFIVNMVANMQADGRPIETQLLLLESP